MNPNEKPKKPAVNELDGRIRRRGAIPLIVMLAVASGIFGSSYVHHSSKVASHEAQQKRMMTSKNRAADVKLAEDIFAEYLDDYFEYQQAGVIGSEHRVDWVQVARDAAQQRKISTMNYKLGVREPFMGDYLFQEGGYELTVSKMNLSWVLLHENDFVSVLERLSDKKLGVYHVKECELRRITMQITLDPEATNITSDCELHWMSVDVSQVSAESAL